MLKRVCLAMFLISVFTANANDWNIKMVHFLPSGQESTIEERDNIRKFSKATQEFFRNEMQRHGYDGKTFELDEEIYIVDGPKKVYNSKQEIDNDMQPFMKKKGWRNGYLVFVDIDEIRGWNCGVAYSWDNGQTRGNLYGGVAYMAYSEKCLLNPRQQDRLVSHEIGHVFGLQHDINSSPETIMTIGNKLNKEQADWLSVSHYFQKNRKFSKAPTLIGQHGLVNDVKKYILTISVEDHSGLHYAQLYFTDMAYFFKLDGIKDEIVFTAQAHSQVHNKLNLNIVDKDGNETWYRMPTPVHERMPLRVEEEHEPKTPLSVSALQLTTTWASIKTAR